jgi:type IV pilus assembly protein PilX
MSQQPARLHALATRGKQGGVVLMVTLVSLVILLLAAIALFRSVDTSTLIAGNLALKQASLAAGDRGVVDAVTVLNAKQVAGGGTVWFTPGHPLNNTDAASAFYSNMDPALNLMADTTWVDGVSSAESAADRGGNTTRYIIQRMCSDPNVDPTPDKCLLNAVNKKNDSMKAGGPKAEKAAANVMYRITIRITGPRNTVSYSQVFVN